MFWQFILLGLVFNITGNSINLFFALTARRISLAVVRKPRTMRLRAWATAAIFAAIAAHLVFLN